MRVAVHVNGELHDREVEPRTLLSDFIRHDVGLTGQGVGGRAAGDADGTTVERMGGDQARLARDRLDHRLCLRPGQCGDQVGRLGVGQRGRHRVLVHSGHLNHRLDARVAKYTQAGD